MKNKNNGQVRNAANGEKQYAKGQESKNSSDRNCSNNNSNRTQDCK